MYSASDYLPTSLTDPEFGPSYAVEKTAWQQAIGTQKPRWEWLEEMIPVSAGLKDGAHGGYPRNVLQAAEGEKAKPRPEHEIFGLAMFGGGKVFGTAHIYGQFMRPEGQE